tara:strand:+ start:641 stop:769 length:129 start_codon:yes stop_codon:yes gene_type:complete
MHDELPPFIQYAQFVSWQDAQVGVSFTAVCASPFVESTSLTA